jgi:chitinase
LASPTLLRVALALAVCLPLTHAQAQEADAKTESSHPAKRLVTDYTSDSKYAPAPYTYSAKDIPYSKITHIIHAGVNFDAKGNLSMEDGFVEPELIPRAHAVGTKVVLLIGGDVVGLEGNQKAIPELLKNLKKFVTKNDYDGLDLDWEYPSSDDDTAFLLTLEKALRSAFPKPRYILSIDVAPWSAESYDPKHLKNVIDWFNVMTYDCAGPWTAHAQLNSPIFWDNSNPAPEECEPGGSDQQSGKIFLADVPAEQINQGTPFYGYEYTNVNKLFGLCPNAATSDDDACDDTVLTVNYGQNVKPMLKHGWVSHRDDKALVPYLLKKDGSDGYVTYDDPLSTYTRVLYSDWVQGLGGTFVWSLDADYDGKSQDLLNAMYDATHLKLLTKF